MARIELTSTAFSNQDFIPPEYTSAGDDISPPLTWSGVPAGTEELVLLCEDPDAPYGTFVHWAVTGIDPQSRGVEAGHSPPGGTELVNGFGEPGWGGPQPPPGDPVHRYIFRLYAIGEPLTLPDTPSAEDIHRAVAGHERAGGILIGRFAAERAQLTDLPLGPGPRRRVTSSKTFDRAATAVEPDSRDADSCTASRALVHQLQPAG